MENQLPQVETTSLMPTPMAAPEDHGSGPVSRRGLLCLAGAMTAAGGAVVYFGARYFNGFRHAGSQPRSAEWMQDLPSGERRLSQSLMNVIQTPLASHQAGRRTFKPPTGGDALVSATLLSAGALGNLTTPLPQIAASAQDTGLMYAEQDRPALPMEKSIHLADEPMLEKWTLWENVHGDHHDAGDVNEPVREKKNTGGMEELTPYNVGHHLDQLFEGQNVTTSMRERFQRQSNYYQNGQLPVFVIQSMIRDAISELRGIVRSSDGILRHHYHSLYFALRMLWEFTKVFYDDVSKAKLEEFKDRLQQERWRERTNHRMPQSGPVQLDEQIVMDYLASRSEVWRQQQLTRDDNIVFHNHQEVRMFSIAEVLDYKHQYFLAESEEGLYFHLQYDNTGLRDPDLVAFVRSAANRQLFINFKQAPRYLPDDHYKVVAEQLMEQHLQQISSTPLNFDHVTAIERAIERAAEKFFPNQKVDRATKETIAAVGHLAEKSTQLTLTKKVVHAYACGYVLAGSDRLFGELEKQQILDSEYIYRYQDGEGKTRSAVTTLDLFLCRGAKELSTDIGKREGVRMLWPEQFSKDLIAYLNDGGQMVNAFASKVAAEVRLMPLERDLTQALPSLSRLLQGYVEEIGLVYGIGQCNLSDQIEFTYKETIPLILGEQKNRGDHVKNMTVMQILTGDERSWKLIDVPLHERLITNIPSTIPAEKTEDYKSYIRSLLVFDVQGRLFSQFADLRKNTDLKASFNEYVDIVTAAFQVKDVPMYEFSDTPLLQIFPVRNPSRQEWEAGRRRSNPYRGTESNAWLKEAEIPFHVVSLVSRKANYFRSYADMIAQLATDTTLAAHIKAHFPVGYASGFSDPAFTEIHTKDDQYERRIDWTMDNFDRIIKSTNEMILFSVIEGAGSIGFVFGEMLSLVHPKLAFLILASSISGSRLLQGTLIATRPDEQKRLLRAALLDLLEEMANKIVGQVGGAYTNKMSEERMEQVDQTVRQSIDLIMDRYLFNTTTDWR